MEAPPSYYVEVTLYLVRQGLSKVTKIVVHYNYILGFINVSNI